MSREQLAAVVERVAPEGAVCRCGGVRVSLVDGWQGNEGDESEAPELCARCGLPVVVLRLVVDERQAKE